MSKERRRFTRINFSGKCIIKDEDTRIQTELLDISLKGALIRTDDGDVYKQDKPCELEIIISETPLVMLYLRARMVHKQADRLGMHFLSTDIDSLTHLRRLIELNMGDADKTLQELFLWSDDHAQSSESFK